VIASFAQAWRFFAGKPRSLRLLVWLDASLIILVCTIAAVIPLSATPEAARSTPYAAMTVNPTLLFLLIHAGMIPMTKRRTAVVHGIAGLVVGAFLVLYVVKYPWLAAGMRPLWFELMWLGFFVAASIYLSGVIWGLREQVHDALQIGQYRLEEKLGEGGMGMVYRASHAMLRRDTAIKLLPPDKGGEESITRFEREVRITAQLTHPNTVSIYDYGRTPDGIFYYAMELLDGVDLEKMVALDGPQPPARVVHILRQVCGALTEAHAHGLIHRDIKPANIILCERGGVRDVAKVVDFGLVKAVAAPDPEQAKLTGINQITGTPHYIAPEAITDPDSVDARSDIYALGATAFFLLTGEEVFRGKGIVEVCSQHLHKEPDSPSQRRGEPVGDALEAAIMQCLSKAPEDRPPSATALAQLLADGSGLEAWGPEDAAKWWSEHKNDVADATRRVDTSKSLVVDFAARTPGQQVGPRKERAVGE
jgi:serine/threonine-protein kinase